MGTDELRSHFHIGGLFQPGRISLTYTHYDRMIVGGAMPADEPLALDAIKPTGTKNFLDRRELIAVNIGGAGTVSCRRRSDHALGSRDMIYVGMGTRAVSLRLRRCVVSRRNSTCSAPRRIKPIRHRLIRIGDAKRLDLGSQATSNERSIFQFIHAEGAKTCQLVVGMTQLAKGSVWNTMPCHVHDRRMEVYLYFDLPETARVFHFMGEPDETRHIVMTDEEAVLSPPWSIHSGAGTSNYAFIWAMAGDNVDYTDVDPVPIGDAAVSDLSAFSLAGKRIVVTGANTGIGQGIAVADRQGRRRGDRRRPLVDGRDGGAGGGRRRRLHAPSPATSATMRPRGAMLDGVWETAGPVDGLVNNAGIIRRADAVDFTEDDWDDVMDVNLKSLFFLCQAFAQEGAGRRAARAASSTSPRCCPSRAASASPPTRRRSMACSASRGCSPASGRRRASTSTPSRRAMS